MDLASHLRTFNRIKNGALEVLFPSQCLGCAKDGGLLCENCLLKFSQFSSPVCPICKRRLSGQQPLNWKCGLKDHSACLRFVLAPAPYKEPLVHKAITLLKYQSVKQLAGTLAETLNKLMKLYNWSEFTLAPVPLHAAKLRQRGFNQAELLAEQISPEMKLPQVQALRKIKNPKPQVGLKAAERLQNQVGAFTCVAKETVQGKNILLVDDVFTTGATLTECARVLKQAGARKVGAAVIAR